MTTKEYRYKAKRLNETSITIEQVMNLWDKFNELKKIQTAGSKADEAFARLFEEDEMNLKEEIVVLVQKTNKT